MEREIPKHKKRKYKTVKKTDHKHDYCEKCLVKLDIKNSYILCLGKRCIICGKIIETDLFLSEKSVHGHKMLSKQDILNKYSELKVYDQNGDIINRTSLLDNQV